MINLILQGKVIKGEAVGRTIDFPTANLKLTKPPKIKCGVYVALVTLKQQRYLGLAYFSPRKNFEVYIFNFKSEIYGQTLTVKLLKFLRSPQVIKNLTQLKKLLELDVASLNNYVILVDKLDKILGIEEKAKAHLGRGRLHRAISVQLYNQKQELLIQKRSAKKQLFAGFWANTVCTDVRPYETYLVAAKRRLQEEFSLAVNKLKPIFKISYSASSGKKHSERELDQVFIGLVTDPPQPNSAEISAWQYLSLDRLKNSSLKLAPWFKLILKKLAASDIFKS